MDGSRPSTGEARTPGGAATQRRPGRRSAGPVSNTRQPPEVIMGTALPRPGRLRVLVVDDNTDAAMSWPRRSACTGSGRVPPAAGRRACGLLRPTARTPS
jgi:hypothetical protein